MRNERVRMKSVVVATDFSPGAASAVTRAALLPLAPAATISVIHVLAEAIPDRFAAAVRERAADALTGVADGLRRAVTERGVDGATVEHALLAGKPHVEIVRHARARAADLVVMGRHGPAPLRDALVGSTAERVIRKGDAPVLLVKEAASHPYRRALVAVDLSDASRRGIDLAGALLPDAVREIALVHACHVAFRSWLGDAALDDYRRELTERAARDAAALAAGVPLECRVAVREGDPRLEVLEQAVRERADLLVVGTHARAGVTHALVGSVAEWLVRSAPCDVAVTRPARFTFQPP
jgi:nucleotide-binding universal stress UspA family protein